MTAANNLTGQIFFGIRVLGRGPNDRKSNAQWRCLCPCGAEFLAVAYTLRGGKIKSCGCRQSFIRHGMSRTRLYSVWAGLHQRCANPKSREYSNYGGRGIAVCDEWREPQSFLDWALATGYQGSLELDRIDNDGPYSPENCRWTTRRANCNNRRITKLIEWRGEPVPLADLARQHGLTPKMLWLRLYQVEMPLEMALTLPVDRQQNKAIMREWRKENV